MLDYSAHVATGSVERCCKELGTPPPQGYVDALAGAATLKANLAKISTPDTAKKMLDRVFACVAEGQHPADDEQVRRLLTMTQLENYELHRQAEERSRRATGDTVQRFADELIQLWSHATADDGAVLADTATRDTFADVADLSAMSPAALTDVDDYKRFSATAAAARRLDAAAAGFNALLAATGLSHRREHKILVLAPAITLSELAAVNREPNAGQSADAWTLARTAGITPRLCGSLAEFVEAVGAVTAAEAHRQSEAAEPAALNAMTNDQRRRYAELTGN